MSAGADPRNPFNWAALVCGAALGAAGVAGAAADWPAQVVLVIVGIGALLIVVPLVAHRLREVKHDGTGWSIYFEIEAVGGSTMAQLLGASGLVGLAEAYAFVHAELKGREFDAVRTIVQDRLVAVARDVATTTALDPEVVAGLFQQGSPVVRVLALGLMEGDTRLFDADVALEAIERSSSGNEQYHGLVLARDRWKYIPADTRQRILDVIATDPHIKGDRDRAAVAADITG